MRQSVASPLPEPTKNHYDIEHLGIASEHMEPDANHKVAWIEASPSQYLDITGFNVGPVISRVLPVVRFAAC
jgi:hypothetical protein